MSSFNELSARKGMEISVRQLYADDDTIKIPLNIGLEKEIARVSLTDKTHLTGWLHHGLKMDGAYLDFRGLDLRGVDFSGVNLDFANFEGADLTGANFTNTSLVSVRLSGAKLDDTDFTGADVSHSFVDEAQFPASSNTSFGKSEGLSCNKPRAVTPPVSGTTLKRTL